MSDDSRKRRVFDAGVQDGFEAAGGPGEVVDGAYLGLKGHKDRI